MGSPVRAIALPDQHLQRGRDQGLPDFTVSADGERNLFESA